MSPRADTYRLPDEHAFLLASEGTDHFMGGLFCMAPVLLRVAPRVAVAFEKGGGVPFEDYGADGVEALDLINRGQVRATLRRTLAQVTSRCCRASGGRRSRVGRWLRSGPRRTHARKSFPSGDDHGFGSGS